MVSLNLPFQYLFHCRSFNGNSRSSHPEVFLRKGILKICSKFTGENPCRIVISINLQSNFIEITLRHECSPVNLLHIFTTPFPGSTTVWLLLKFNKNVYSKISSKSELFEIFKTETETETQIYTDKKQ